MSNSKLTGRLLQSTILVGAFAAATPAFSQEQGAEREVDTITVTGTLIRRADVEAPSPVSSVDSGELTVVNTVNTEEFLNTLPQAVPGFDSTSNNPGDGVATANLRGLGSNRTLVLVNGRRFVPYDAGGVVDLNTIPAALIDQIDVVTGGASATYGSDAMAGVVNFILKDDFEGLELETSFAGTEQEDGQIFQASVIAGGNFDDGRGNATFFAAYTNREPVFAGEREFSSVTNFDALIGEEFPPGGSSGIPGSRLFDDYDFSALPGYTSGSDACLGPNGNAVNGLNADCEGGATFNADGEVIPFTDFYNYAPVNYLQLPQERYNLAGFANYDITDTIRLNLRGLYSQNVVAQELAPTPLFETVTVVEGQTPISDSFETLLVSNGIFDPNNDEAESYDVFIGRRLLEVGPRNSNRDQNATQWSADLEGELGNGMQWTTYAQFARSSGSVTQTGNASISSAQDNFTDGTCDFFRVGGISDECVTAIARTGIINTTYEQTILGAQLSGEVPGFQSPLANTSIAFAAGVEYREEFGDFQPDSVLGPDVSGFNQSLPISGRYDVADVFGELQVPLVEGVTGVELLSFNGAYRRSDYSTIGSTDTYTVGGRYSPIPGWQLKASYARAVRAPNISELFSPLTNGFPGAFDPCAAAPNGDSQGGVRDVCLREGVPSDAFDTSALQPNLQTEGLFGGNENLDAEVADTFTIGVLAQPQFANGLTLKVDYFDIEIEDVISTIPIQTVLSGCYIQDVQSLCDLVQRQPNGQIDFVELTSQNLALLTSKGLDFEVDYTIDARDMGLGDYGTFGLRFIGTYQMEAGFQALPDGSPNAYFYDLAGYFPGRGGVGFAANPQPEWKHVAFLDWALGDLTTTLRWQYIGGVDADDILVNQDPDPDNDFDNVGNFRGSSIDAFNYFTLTAQYQMTEALRLQVGVNNLFDETPPIGSSNFTQQANTFPATYDPLGRRYFVGLRASF